MNPAGYEIRVTGVVQGVGFRPMVHHVASSMGLHGTVSNDSQGVTIRLYGVTDAECSAFVDAMRRQRPVISSIDNVEVNIVDVSGVDLPDGFCIIASECGDGDGGVTDVSPDIAICAECLADMDSQPRRKDYPLTNCTHCGPRFTITRSLPYDRPVTSMDEFEMCPDCRSEYTDQADRRFHAQPIACRRCGPVYMMDGDTDIGSILRRSADVLSAGGVLMVKGLGGYNILADATSEHALAELRRLKNRPRKPFAVMVRDQRMASRFVDMSEAERESLVSWRAPIVVCRRTSEYLPDMLAPGLKTLGVMLPYMGFQHMLMRMVDRPLAVTSANFPSMPIIADDEEARRYADMVDVPLVSYNRKIHNRVDDSVVRVIDGEPRILRRARGFVPDPLRVAVEVDGMMALGADVTGGWALGRGSDIIASQYIGSLASGEGAEMFLRESIDKMSALYRFSPKVIAVDAHRGYASTRIGREIAAQLRRPVVEVWHHHAHAAAVMAEYGLGGEVLALVLDGTGAGPDGTVWGSELLRCSLSGFTRLDHGPYLHMPGGDVAAREPWRMAVALWRYLGRQMDTLPEPVRHYAGESRITMLNMMMEKGINSPMSCGAGRLWDAVAALAGLCMENSYEAEAPIVLEGAAESDPSGLAHCFHEEYAERWIARVTGWSRRTGLNRVVLTGGVMQNDLFVTRLATGLRAAGVDVYVPRKIPPGDASIAVGQLAVVASMNGLIMT